MFAASPTPVGHRLVFRRQMSARLPGILALLILLAALGLSACGSDDDDDSGGGSAGATQEPAAPGAGDETETQAPADLTDTSVKPVIEKPTGSPPRKLQIEDIVEGKGPGARPGDTVVVHYVGVNFSNGQEFDASWDAGQPFPVELGSGQVIPGWERGLVGVKRGGRRKLVIPPEQAYGAAGAPPSIGPNETLVFVIDALEIQ
jgi:peptidylprolyl isomerase